MAIFASCGHCISSAWFLDDRSNVAVVARDRTGDRVVSYEVRCPECRAAVVADGRLLESAEAEHSWLYHGVAPESPARPNEDLPRSSRGTAGTGAPWAAESP